MWAGNVKRAPGSELDEYVTEIFVDKDVDLPELKAPTPLSMDTMFEHVPDDTINSNALPDIRYSEQPRAKHFATLDSRPNSKDVDQ